MAPGIGPPLPLRPASAIGHSFGESAPASHQKLNNNVLN